MELAKNPALKLPLSSSLILLSIVICDDTVLYRTYDRLEDQPSTTHHQERLFTQGHSIKTAGHLVVLPYSTVRTSNGPLTLLITHLQLVLCRSS